MTRLHRDCMHIDDLADFHRCMREADADAGFPVTSHADRACGAETGRPLYFCAWCGWESSHPPTHELRTKETPSMPDTVLTRCIDRRQDAITDGDDESQQVIDHAVLYLLTVDEYTRYEMAARAQDGDASRRPWDNTAAFSFPYYCRVCHAFTGDDRHDHEGDREPCRG